MRTPVAQAIIGIALLSFMDAAIKALVVRLPVIEVAFLRYLVGSLVLLTALAVRRPGFPRPDTVRANATRALLVVITATTFFYGLGQLPLAEALIISFVSPIFTAVLAAALLRERVDARIALALIGGFLGVAVIVWGGFGAGEGGPAAATEGSALLGVAAILVSAIGYSASNVLLRSRAQRDPLIHIVAIQNFVPFLILAVPAVWVWVPPEPAEAALLLVVGLLGAGGHICLARAYAGAQATRLAALDYTALIWAVLNGVVVFGEIPTLWAWLGAGLILGAAALAGRR